jgi:DNA-binding XRE family transcriptional regulator
MPFLYIRLVPNNGSLASIVRQNVSSRLHFAVCEYVACCLPIASNRGMDVAKRLGKNVRRLRRAADIPQDAFAEMVGINRVYLSGIERGLRNPTIEVVANIADALKVDVSKLFEPLD